jgi:hypothetical protein
MDVGTPREVFGVFYIDPDFPNHPNKLALHTSIEKNGTRVKNFLIPANIPHRGYPILRTISIRDYNRSGTVKGSELAQNGYGFWEVGVSGLKLKPGTPTLIEPSIEHPRVPSSRSRKIVLDILKLRLRSGFYFTS